MGFRYKRVISRSKRKCKDCKGCKYLIKVIEYPKANKRWRCTC